MRHMVVSFQETNPSKKIISVHLPFCQPRFLNDKYCDCPNCEDEPLFSCADCGCPTQCGQFRGCFQVLLRQKFQNDAPQLRSAYPMLCELEKTPRLGNKKNQLYTSGLLGSLRAHRISRQEVLFCPACRSFVEWALGLGIPHVPCAQEAYQQRSPRMHLASVSIIAVGTAGRFQQNTCALPWEVRFFLGERWLKEENGWKWRVIFFRSYVFLSAFFWLHFSSQLLCFSVFPCVFAFQLFCFCASLLLHFSLLACFSAFLRFLFFFASLLPCFFSSVLFCFFACLLSFSAFPILSLLFCFFASLLSPFLSLLIYANLLLPACFVSQK